MLRPFWYPRTLEVRSRQKLFWPTGGTPIQEQAINVQLFNELLFACRVEGRPKALVRWTINGNSVDMISYASASEVQQGRSLLTVNITNVAEKNTFSTSVNTIRCFASNAAGSTEGSIQKIGSCESCIVLSQHIMSNAYSVIRFLFVFYFA